MTQAVCELRAAGVRFDAVRALQPLNLLIGEGERVALVGANGSGKSTLLRLIHGLIAPSEGQVTCHPRLRQAMLFQRPQMLRASVLDNAALGLRLAGVPAAQAREQALAALHRVELAALAERAARTLSGGQQQRLALARALATGPRVLLLDEPTASLDPHAKREVEAQMASLAAAGLTLVFSSHNLGQVKRMATRVLYLEGGECVCDLPTDDFFNGPLPQRAALFVKGELA